MSKIKRRYILLIICILSIFIYYLPMPINHINVFNNISIEKVSVVTYDYSEKYRSYEINESEEIDELTKFLDKIIVQRRTSKNKFSYKQNENGEYMMVISNLKKDIQIYIKLYNHEYIAIDNKLYKVIGKIDYNQLNSIIKNEN
ncbi:hypothetical protein JYG23_04215 [Sedimentibacter sp. zth1]|uniref:hypothetical protein n=1 Tax=Sedimentibacter sp. zth1 TaxID=2816908 RepID=UPI001A91F63F|nr:hypothetical protein [Sedimentibacter sp. zth1]QSX06666.1 hypothetical protein JYG23_04215 [Sedimentibacter sp. zth1]